MRAVIRATRAVAAALLDHGACLLQGHDPYLVDPNRVLCTRCYRRLYL